MNPSQGAGYRFKSCRGHQNYLVKSNYYQNSPVASCGSLHDFPVYFVRDPGCVCTKPVQFAAHCVPTTRCGPNKNPGSAATETGVKVHVKASSFPNAYSVSKKLPSRKEVLS